MLTSETIDDEQEVERRLFDRSANLAITRRPIGLPNVVCVPFMVENLFIYAPATDPIAQQTSVRLADLDGRTFLMTPTSLLGRHDARGTAQRANHHAAGFQRARTADSHV